MRVYITRRSLSIEFSLLAFVLCDVITATLRENSPPGIFTDSKKTKAPEGALVLVHYAQDDLRWVFSNVLHQNDANLVLQLGVCIHDESSFARHLWNRTPLDELTKCASLGENRKIILHLPSPFVVIP